MNLTKKIKDSGILYHILVAFCLAVAIIWITVKLLDIFTLHGKSQPVPDLMGLTESEVKANLKGTGLRYKIIDSIFDDHFPKGTVANQDPLPETRVKKSRTIYITKIAILPEMVAVPDIKDLSLRQGLALLHAHGLREGNLEYRPDIANNAILEQNFRGEPISPGTSVGKGSKIDLIIGRGLDQALVTVPVLIGKTREEALSMIRSSMLSLGLEEFIDDPDDNPVVYDQRPNPVNLNQRLNAGSAINLVYRSANKFDFDEYVSALLYIEIPNLKGKSPNDIEIILSELFLEIGNETFQNNVTRQKAKAVGQMPEYKAGTKIKKGSKIDVWYGN
jgi:beta-lactam-binding protein with PASTA domain